MKSTQNPQLEGMAILLPVSDMSAAQDFYQNVLKFELRTRSDDGTYVLLARDNAAVGLLQGSEEFNHDRSAYVWVDDVDALFDELKPGLESLPEGDLRPPFRQPYGMREFHVKDPSGVLWFFGQAAELA